MNVNQQLFLPLREAIRPTTFIEAAPLSKLLDADVTLASETFQHTGSFKFRAAYNVAANVPNQTIVAASSGNFGQAIARACQMLGKQCTVVMPETSARVKIEAVRRYEATADLIDTRKIGRMERVLEIVRDQPDAYVSSAYDDPLVIEGNATLGDEIAGYEKKFDAVISCIGGGGLSSGVIQGLRRNNDQAEVYGAEPLLGNDAAQSLRAGRIIRHDIEPMTIADGARTISLGEHNWRILQNGLKGIVEVDDSTIETAVRVLFSYANLKVEPTGALTIGALMTQPELFAGKKVCCIVSGGNVDATVYQRILSGN